MLQTAQLLYEQEVPTFTKVDLDKFGVRSHNLAVYSHEAGWFKGEIIPVEGNVEGNLDIVRILSNIKLAFKMALHVPF